MQTMNANRAIKVNFDRPLILTDINQVAHGSASIKTSLERKMEKKISRKQSGLLAPTELQEGSRISGMSIM